MTDLSATSAATAINTGTSHFGSGASSATRGQVQRCFWGTPAST